MAARALNDDEVITEMNKMVRVALVLNKEVFADAIYIGRVHQAGSPRESS